MKSEFPYTELERIAIDTYRISHCGVLYECLDAIALAEMVWVVDQYNKERQ